MLGGSPGRGLLPRNRAERTPLAGHFEKRPLPNSPRDRHRDGQGCPYYNVVSCRTLNRLPVECSVDFAAIVNGSPSSGKGQGGVGQFAEHQKQSGRSTRVTGDVLRLDALKTAIKPVFLEGFHPRGYS